MCLTAVLSIIQGWQLRGRRKVNRSACCTLNALLTNCLTACPVSLKVKVTIKNDDKDAFHNFQSNVLSGFLYYVRFLIFCCHISRQRILKTTQSRKYNLLDKCHWGRPSRRNLDKKDRNKKNRLYFKLYCKGWQGQGLLVWQSAQIET